MSDRFTDYTEAAVGDTRGQLIWKVELIGPDGELLATDVEAEATGDAERWEVDADPGKILADRKAQRTSRMRVPSTGQLVPSATGGPLHPDHGSRVRVWAGVRTAGGDKWWPQSTLALEETRGTDQAGLVELVVDLVDAVEPVRSDLVTAFRFEAGETVGSVVGRLLGQVIPADGYRLPDIGATVIAGDAETGDDRFELVNDLLEGVGHELVADPYGVVTARRILPSGDDSAARRWAYGTTSSPGRILLESPTRTWSARSARAWKAEGGVPLDGTPATSLTVFDLDPSSQGFFPGLSIPIQVRSTRHPFTSATADLVQAAYGNMRRHGIGPGIIAFETIPNPAMRQGDIVDLTIPSFGLADAPHRVLGMTLPYRNTSKMVVVARGAWEPDLGYTAPGLDVDPNCLPSHLDLFDAGDGDLQILPGADDGSALWTEIGFSWGVEGGWAVQRYGGTQGQPNPPWSLAFVNRPLCDSNQYAEVTIRRIPPGRRIGPVVRCDASFSGYAALVSADEISLEVWLNGRSVATLGRHQLTGSPVGGDVRVEAVGQAIEVRFDGTPVITSTDDRLTGAHVGMLGYGGSGSNAPAVQPFAAGPAT